GAGGGGAPSGGRANRHRRAEQIALAQGDPQLAENHELRLGLDPLRDQLRAGLRGEVREPGDEGPADRVAIDVVDPLDVELHVCGPERKDVAEAGIARPRVVDRELYVRPPAIDGRAYGVVVLAPLVLRDLDDSRPARAGDDLRERRLVLQDVGREVHAERDVRRLRLAG